SGLFGSLSLDRRFRLPLSFRSSGLSFRSCLFGSRLLGTRFRLGRNFGRCGLGCVSSLLGSLDRRFGFGRPGAFSHSLRFSRRTVRLPFPGQLFLLLLFFRLGGLRLNGRPAVVLGSEKFLYG
ncbi:MAG: hypothetical protein Q4F72_07735, partial [Desulfovibrionaceae bacterium]|nr:hypothetical protein [Desulfovibrionaceae bacterium]